MKHICDYPDSHIVRTFDIAAISLPIVYKLCIINMGITIQTACSTSSRRMQIALSGKRGSVSGSLRPSRMKKCSRWCCGQMWAMKSASTFITV